MRNISTKLKCLFLGHKKVNQGIFLNDFAYRTHCSRCEKGFDGILCASISLHPPFKKGSTIEEKQAIIDSWNEFMKQKYKGYKYIEKYLPSLETSWQNRK